MNEQKKTQYAKEQQATGCGVTGRKGFEAPQLRREAELTEATAERTFTFTTAS